MEFKLPEIGEGVHEGELIRWLVKNGDSVTQDQPLIEVMTDKATVEVPSPSAGVISGIASKEGDMIKVGQLLAQIANTAKTDSATQAAAPKEQPKQVVSSVPAQGAEAAPNSGRDAARAPQSTTVSAAGAGSVGPYVSALDSHNASSVPAAPIVRVMAAQAGVDLSAVPATGPAVGGRARVLEEDLLKFLNGRTSASATPVAVAATPMAMPAPRSFSFGGSVSEEVERKPVRGLRRVIAQAMVRSKYTAPHYSYVDEFECSALVALREEAKALAEKQGIKFTYLPFIVKALVGALREFPVANSSLEESNGNMELVYKKFFHIGVAVATPDGLVVPVIKHADKKTLLEIAQEIAYLSQKVRDGKATGEDLKGSTFTITSMGNIGGLFATPIINYPEVGILGVYKVQEKPIVQNGQIVVGKTMHLSLSLDHRVVDGAVGGNFCNAIISRLQNPAKLLLEMV